jgi:hypothetical protein
LVKAAKPITELSPSDLATDEVVVVELRVSPDASPLGLVVASTVTRDRPFSVHVEALRLLCTAATAALAGMEHDVAVDLDPGMRDSA